MSTIHTIFLSEAIFVLLGESITLHELDHAEKLLQHFCLMFSALYPEGKKLSMFIRLSALQMT